MSAAATYTPLSWAKELLKRLGDPDTPDNESAIIGWEQAEGGNWHNPDRFNPLDTTQDEPGAVSTNSVGVKAYTSWDQGFDATITTLTNGLYQPILTALGVGNDSFAVTDAVNSSKWGTHGAFPAPTGVGYATETSTGPQSSAASSASKSSGGGGCDSPSGLSIVNPGSWAKYVVCKVEEDAKPALFTVAAVLAGTTLVVVGLWRSVSHTETYKTAKQTATSAAMSGAVE